MSVVGGGGEKIHTPSLSQGGYPDGLGQGAGTSLESRAEGVFSIDNETRQQKQAERKKKG